MELLVGIRIEAPFLFPKPAKRSTLFTKRSACSELNLLKQQQATKTATVSGTTMENGYSANGPPNLSLNGTAANGPPNLSLNGTAANGLPNLSLNGIAANGNSDCGG
ncbi:cell envelope-related function transcriptional attenuator common domain [Senna tora]|uniref:Cell envelope-related function transcriptional attenuator common domain n=1 Tax=Senna tora TaxID=362788 RepID=A0A834VYV8_9FABA|nr:cell envelope-related function transcriptional attenuator common domain [Senna tora]